ncbi:potassium voltage-gated channel subfamily E member 3 [Antrostomus carolinensis]|nr:potassium voltage-gated channel subfamily E member 3 [Antrostomus carolinensis]
MEEDNQTETWHRSFQAVLNALNQTLHGRKVDKRSDPYHVYIKNRVSMI